MIAKGSNNGSTVSDVAFVRGFMVMVGGCASLRYAAAMGNSANKWALVVKNLEIPCNLNSTF